MFSVLGGIFGVLVLSLAAPALAEVALNFSSFEYFWLVMLGFTCAIFIAGKDPVKGIVSLLIGLLISVVGLENPAGAPRYTFGNAEMMGGIPLIPLMIGMFAVSEILRYAAVVAKPVMAVERPFGNVFAGMWTLLKKYPVQLFRGSALGTRSVRCPAPAPTSPRGCPTPCRSASRRSRRSSAPAMSKASSNRARPTTRRWAAPGSRRWCSAFRATRSPPSPSACCISRA